MEKPDSLILDLGLPDMDGIEVLRRLREWTTVPVLILSVRPDPADKVSAIDLAPDDYLTNHSTPLNSSPGCGRSCVESLPPTINP